jgi:hypothetical protein
MSPPELIRVRAPRRTLRGLVLSALLAPGLLVASPSAPAHAQGWVWQVPALAEGNFNVVPTPAGGVIWMVPTGGLTPHRSDAYDPTTVGIPSAQASAFILGTRYTEVLAGVIPPGLRRATPP